jgi:hypothetical protein
LLLEIPGDLTATIGLFGCTTIRPKRQRTRMRRKWKARMVERVESASKLRAAEDKDTNRTMPGARQVLVYPVRRNVGAG